MTPTRMHPAGRQGPPDSATHPPWADDHRLLKVHELASLLNVSRRKAYSLLGHTIPVVTLGRRCRRVRLADVLEFIEARRG